MQVLNQSIILIRETKASKENKQILSIILSKIDFTYILRRLKMPETKKKKSWIKKGITSFEAVIGTLIFLFLFCAVCDLLMLSNQYSTLTDTGKELARTISVQGGALETKPAGYASNYYNITQLEALVAENMRTAGFDDGDWLISIDYTKYYDDESKESKDYTGSGQNIIGFNDTTLTHSPTLKIDYLSNFTLKIMAKYHWRFLQSFIPDRTTTLTVTMPGTSEWKYNYDAWESEKTHVDTDTP